MGGCILSKPHVFFLSREVHDHFCAHWALPLAACFGAPTWVIIEAHQSTRSVSRDQTALTEQAYLFGLLTCPAQVRRSWLSVRLFYLLTVGLGLAGLALGTVLTFCGFGRFCLGLRRLAGGILRLREKRVFNDDGISNR